MYAINERVLDLCSSATYHATTDDRGEYRLFGLEPGTYYLGTAEPSSPVYRSATVIGGREVPQTRVADSRCSNLLYPGVWDPANAVPFALKSSDVNGIDLRLTRATRHTVKLKIEKPIHAPNPFEQPLVAKITRVSPDGARTMVYQGAGTGTFEGDTYTSPALPPGSYELEVSDTGVLASEVGLMRFEIVDRDLDAGTLSIPAATLVQGRIRGEGPLPQDWTPARLALRIVPLNIRGLYMVQPSPPIDADGTFKLGMRGVGGSFPIGRYLYEFSSGLDEDLYLASAKAADGRDTLDGGLVLDGSPVSPLELTIRMGGQVTGVVRNAKDGPASDSLVALIPSESRRGNLLLFKTAQTEEDGRFSIRGVAPGEYILLAWEEDVEPNAVRNLEFLKPFEARGTKILVNSGTTGTATLRVIPAATP